MTGAQAFWHAPIEGLRVGATFLRASIDFNLTFSPENTEALIMAGLVPADYDGKLVISQRPDTWAIGSVELLRGPWLLAAEYNRAFKHQTSNLPDVVPTFDEDSERFYAMANCRESEVDCGATSFFTLEPVEDEQWKT